MKFEEHTSLEESLQPILSVSEFIEYSNLLLGRKQVVVEGEISSFTVSQGKWVFFDLKDASSTVSCFSMLYRITTQLTDGMQVRITGTPRVHQKSGRFSIFVDAVELSGYGSLKKAFELTKAKLEKEGIFDSARKRALPAMPHCIGLICSQESAAYSDFIRILNQRWGGVDILLAHVQVQGQSAIQEIAGAFEYFNTAGTDAELLVLIRGGGSLEDLQAFNSEQVARAVFGSRLPVICGVGHERDESLADYAADVRAATPTHAATLTVPDRNELILHIGRMTRTIESGMDRAIEWHGHQLQTSLSHMSHRIAARIERFHFLTRTLSKGIAMMGTKIDEHTRSIQRAYVVLESSLERVLTAKQTAIDHLGRNLSNMNPLTVLGRGYSIVREGKKIIKKKGDVSPGSHIDITFSDGEVSADITKVQQQAPLF